VTAGAVAGTIPATAFLLQAEASSQRTMGGKFQPFLEGAGGYIGLRHIWDYVIEHDADEVEQCPEHRGEPTSRESTQMPG